ncbi:multidrug DMT transporter permease [Amphritea opalescens]|uniref:Multidrug DMT transporter permease n=1 Tax=Amphritea opalescens TaxID=2490544 RepID=A0A430KTW1_9GAMM|nr:DMT family transporter [Amphritea opalescens]RTE66888.1 multidrug DMT transporter permease [Amphritea opalescens]
MSVLAAILLTISALFHASWNLLGKKVHPSPAFFLVANIMACLCLLPVVAINLNALLSIPLTVWGLVLITGFFQAIYMWGLAGAYKHGAISVAYPLLRASPVLFIALLTALLGQGAALTTTGIIGVLLVSIGCLLIPMPSLRGIRVSAFLNLSCLFALIAAIGTVGYTLADDKALSTLRNLGDLPLTVIEISLLYLFLENLSCSLWLALITIPQQKNRRDLVEIAQKHLSKATLTGFSMTITYAIVLISMAYVENVSYVVVFRQLSIPIAVMMGIVLLKENGSIPKFVGTISTFLGIIIISI